MNPLLQHPLPTLKKTLPDVWLIHPSVTGIDELRVGMRGCAQAVVPRIVQEAVEEVLSRQRGQITPQQQTEVLCALMLRYGELYCGEYVEYEPVSTLPIK